VKRGIGATAVAPGAARAAGTAGNSVASVRALVTADRGRSAVLVALASGSALLLTISFAAPAVHEPPTMYAATETLLTLLALGSAWLMRGRFLQTHYQSDLLLAVAVLAFGIVHLAVCAIPAAIHHTSHTYLTGTAACGELIVAALFASAAFAPDEPCLVGLRRPNRLLLVTSGAILGVAAIVAVTFEGELVVGGGRGTHAFAVVVVAASAAFLIGAAVGFARNKSARREGGTLLLAGAAVFFAAAALSKLNGKFEPDSASAAQALRMLALAAIAGAALRWQGHARLVALRAVALAERQRVARDLHDGLAQDLALIAAHGQHVGGNAGVDQAIVAASRRALQISRSAIVELSDPTAAEVDEALEAIASECRRRFDVGITLDVQVAGELSPEVQEDVSRIVQEAIVNAARHGGAKNVVVWLHGGGGRFRLRVIDDGCGIDAAAGAQQREGFGLRSTRERATALGGYVHVRQLGAEGTVLDVVLR
jgi:signal transduction histidine kinase